MLLSGLLGATAVVMGALDQHAPTLFQHAPQFPATGVFYQLIHAVALFGVGVSLISLRSRLLEGAAVAFGVGCLLFSGGLYLRAMGIEGAGFLTPYGGMSFIAGWVLSGVGGMVATRR